MLGRKSYGEVEPPTSVRRSRGLREPRDGCLVGLSSPRAGLRVLVQFVPFLGEMTITPHEVISDNWMRKITRLGALRRSIFLFVVVHVTNCVTTTA